MFSRFARPSSIRTLVMRSAIFRFCSGVRPSTQVICTCGIAFPSQKSIRRILSQCSGELVCRNSLLKGGGKGRRRSGVLVLGRDGARPDYFEGGFATDEHFGALADANGQRVFGVRTKLAQAFFFGLQALVGSIQGDPELVWSGGQEALKPHWVGSRVFTQPGG